jgi:hypothetical protein
MLLFTGGVHSNSIDLIDLFFTFFLIPMLKGQNYLQVEHFVFKGVVMFARYIKRRKSNSLDYD